MFFIPTKVQLGHVKVNSIGRLSSFSVGENRKINNNNTSKKLRGSVSKTGTEQSSPSQFFMSMMTT